MLGFTSDQLQQGMAHDSPVSASADEFFDGAGEALDDLHGAVAEEIVPFLPNLAGRWHPSGFMVYPLGRHATLGTLRLHIWPEGFRERQSRGHGLLQSSKLGAIHDGDIHNHAWHIVSHNYAGYEDRFINPAPINDSLELMDDGAKLTADIYRMYRVSYREDGSVYLKPQLLDEHNYGHDQPYGRGWVTAFVDPTVRSMFDGDLHLIEAGRFHIPLIPTEQFAATLAINSDRVCQGPDVLLRGHPEVQAYSRLAVNPEQADIARHQLLAAIGSKACS